MAKVVRLADIAQKLGVSNVAVSKALSGKSGVSEELRIKIKILADEMGYISKKSTGNGSSETGNIGVVVPEKYYEGSFSFYGRLYEKVVRALYENEYYGILELLTKDKEKSGDMPRIMQDAKVDGVILLGQMDEAYIRKIVVEADLPVFFLDTYLPFVELDTVISDGYYGTYQLCNHLIQKGHRRLAFVGSVDATSSIADRYWGYRRALRESGIVFEPAWEIPDRDAEGRLFERIPFLQEGVDAYVCNCDYTAYLLLKNLEEQGLRVPEDISLVGFDHFLPLGMEEHHITTYEVDVERMAELCVKSLIRKIKHKRYGKGIQIVNGRIIEKQSVKQK